MFVGWPRASCTCCPPPLQPPSAAQPIGGVLDHALLDAALSGSGERLRIGWGARQTTRRRNAAHRQQRQCCHDAKHNHAQRRSKRCAVIVRVRALARSPRQERSRAERVQPELPRAKTLACTRRRLRTGSCGRQNARTTAFKPPICISKLRRHGLCDAALDGVLRARSPRAPRRVFWHAASRSARVAGAASALWHVLLHVTARVRQHQQRRRVSRAPPNKQQSQHTHTHSHTQNTHNKHTHNAHKTHKSRSAAPPRRACPCALPAR